MPSYSNTSGVSLSIAVFLATDSYDYDPDTISATSLIKPLRQIVLAPRVDSSLASTELTNMVASRMGTAIHDGIERAWITNHRKALAILGYPQKVIDRVIINPEPGKLPEDAIPIYLEKRSKRQLGNYTISGKFDFVSDGRVEDFKSTSTYTVVNNTNDAKYILQGSIYRWLNPTIITKDDMAIQFIFTDWAAMRAKTDPSYPQQRVQQRILPLMSLVETENWLRNKLALVDQFLEAEESTIPLCSDEDLWRSAPVYKYYKNPEKTVRSTKNFDTMQEAYLKRAEDGNVGIVKEQPGQVTACKYCPAFAACTQKDALIARGDLVL